MQLIGQYDSPFVRRVGIALTLYGFAFEHLPLSTFGDADAFRAHNPLTRVPTLVLDDGEALIESGAILDHLDEQAEHPLIARFGPARRAALQRTALATGTADKAVSYFYARLFGKELDADFAARCEGQIKGGLAALDAQCAARTTAWWHGETPGHDDIAVACIARFLSEAYAYLVQLDDTPALAAHSRSAEALPVFQTICQPFIPPQ